MERPQHAPNVCFPRVGDEISVGGIPLSLLVARVGRTPFYAYDRALIKDRIAHLRAILPPEVRLHYAAKANPMPAVVGHVAGLLDGIDVASGRELLSAVDAGATPGEISFAGPAKSDIELQQAVGAGILINVEAPREIELLADISR